MSTVGKFNEFGTLLLDITVDEAWKERRCSYIQIKFQEGPILEVGHNGCQIEDVIDVLLDRLRGFNEGPFRCRENSLAITALEDAQNWLLRRTLNRAAQGVEGHSLPHTC